MDISILVFVITNLVILCIIALYLTKVKKEGKEQFKYVIGRIGNDASVVEHKLMLIEEKVDEHTGLYEIASRDVLESLAANRKEANQLNEAFKEHLEQVTKVLAAAMPYMTDKELTPENVVKAFKELEEDSQYEYEEAVKRMDSLVSGSDFE